MKTIKEIMENLPQNTKVSRQVVQAYVELHEELLHLLNFLSPLEWCDLAANDYIGSFSDTESLNAYLLDRAAEYGYDHKSVNIDPTGVGGTAYVDVMLGWNGGHAFLIS